jgi:hypothetical protein
MPTFYRAKQLINCIRNVKYITFVASNTQIMNVTLDQIEKLLDRKLKPIIQRLDSIDSRLDKLEKWLPVENTYLVTKLPQKASKSSRVST